MTCKSCTPYIVVGLGNPGPRYAETRHNVGFKVVNHLARERKVDRWRQHRQALVAETVIRQRQVLLVKPLTYMNRSGEAVQPLVEHWDVPLDRLGVVYDDVHLDPGVLRIRRKGSDGGHNGMKSLIDSLGSQSFPRFRIGIGESADDRIDHVLSEFTPEERPLIEAAIEETAEAVMVWLDQGVDAAMNIYNSRSSRETSSEERA